MAVPFVTRRKTMVCPVLSPLKATLSSILGISSRLLKIPLNPIKLISSTLMARQLMNLPIRMVKRNLPPTPSFTTPVEWKTGTSLILVRQVPLIIIKSFAPALWVKSSTRLRVIVSTLHLSLAHPLLSLAQLANTVTH